eukprot:scaffold311608_cov34-Prasinocladus_malaysianus.AAC.1
MYYPTTSGYSEPGLSPQPVVWDRRPPPYPAEPAGSGAVHEMHTFQCMILIIPDTIGDSWNGKCQVGATVESIVCVVSRRFHLSG